MERRCTPVGPTRLSGLAGGREQLQVDAADAPTQDAFGRSGGGDPRKLWTPGQRLRAMVESRCGAVV